MSFFLCRYVRLLGAMYMRLTGTAVDCYKYLEPLYNDYRKIKSQNRDGGKTSVSVSAMSQRHVVNKIVIIIIHFVLYISSNT